MPWRHGIGVLAILAALAAPSSVLGATPNELSAPYVSPTSGYTTTPIILSVHYYSAAGNPAQSVSASVGGASMPLALVTGSAVNGTWTGGGMLPAGTWTVTFHATVGKGPQPTVTYDGTITIVGVVLATPRPSDSSLPSGSADGPGGGGGSSSQPAPQASATPQPSSEPAAASQSSAPRATSSGAAAPGSATSGGAGTDNDTSGSGGGGAGKTPGVHPRPSSSRGSGAAGSASPDGSAASPAASPGSGGTDRPNDMASGSALWMVLLVGISAVAGVALAGTAWLLVAARRERAAEVAAIQPDLAARAIPAVEQRALRRARLRSSSDPILAGLGLDDDETAEPAPGSGRQAAKGRPASQARTPRRSGRR